MANIRDVARAAGVGIGTVSRALNDSGYVEAGKKEKIRRIAKELNYRPVSCHVVLFRKRADWLGLYCRMCPFRSMGPF